MIVYLNLIRSIRRVLAAVSAYLEISPEDINEEAELEREAHSSSFRELRLRLSPLLQIEESLMKDMGVPDEFGNASIPRSASPRAQNNPGGDGSQPEYFVRPNSGWKSKLLLTSLRRQATPSETPSVSPGIDVTDRGDPGHILVACGQDVKTLWNDTFIQSVLIKRRLRLEDEGGL